METIEAEVRQFGTETNLIVWEGIPWGWSHDAESGIPKS